MPGNDDKTQTFRLLEQPCALRPPEKAADLRRPGRAYDFALSDSDYRAAARGTGKDIQRSDAPQPDGKAGKACAISHGWKR